MATSLPITRNPSGTWRLSPAQYRLALTAHVMVSVGWLGAVFAKIVLGLAAMMASAPAAAAALLLAMNVVNVAYPPLAIGTLVSGVVLALGTKWGLLQHYWVATKLALTVGVIATAIQLTDRIMRQSAAAPVGPGGDGATLLGLAAAPTLLLALAVTHLLMLAAATVLSVYKPWGKTWWGRRQATRQTLGRGRGAAAEIEPAR
ncbi:MAG TPA: DUF2269 domain-containing protein [Chloroflexota bacterium]|nr:DUF2269 domain-containing protein [Chloroflexota bacterium]